MSSAKSEDSPGSAVNIVSWFLLVMTTLAIFARIVTKQAVSHKLSGDDVIVLAALVSFPLGDSQRLSAVS